MLAIILLLVVCGLPLMLIFGGGGSDDSVDQLPAEESFSQDAFEQESVQELPTRTPAPVTLPAASSDGQTWLVMLYQGADDKILEQDIYLDFNEAERIGSTDREAAIYTVDGIYTYADGGETRYARLCFNDGLLRQLFGFTNEQGLGAPREITPSPGDTFTILEKWHDRDARGNVTAVARQEGATLIFGDQMFSWVDLNAAPGDYQVGFIVEDLDGNRVQAYETITVEWPGRN